MKRANVRNTCVDGRGAIEAKTPNTVDELVGKIAFSLTPGVMECLLPLKFKIPVMDTFDGSKDLIDHLETFKALMHLQAMLDEIRCRAFQVILKGSA